MRVPRVHLPVDLSIGTSVELSEEAARHVLRVLRLRDGAEVRVFNGEAGDWIGHLRTHGKRGASVAIDRFEPRATESSLDITLVQGISRGRRMDYTLEKSVELGVRRVIPVVMERTQAAPTGERIARKARHWAGVLAAATAQCGRTRRPELEEQAGFREWLDRTDCNAHPHVLLDPDAESSPHALGSPAALILIAGPEGGFSPAEREAAYAAGCRGIRLGPRILRTETAAVASLAVLQALYGDLR